MNQCRTSADLRERLSSGSPLFGVWNLLPGAITGELIASCGPDYVVVDLQHGAISETELPGVMNSIRKGGSTPLVRVRSSEFADIGRALDLGAEGVIVPSITSVDHARRVLGHLMYPPSGTRSSGKLCGSSEDAFRVVMIETSGALSDIDDILSLEGVDAIYVGPADLSLSLGLDRDSKEFARVLAEIISRSLSLHMPVGVHTHDVESARAFALAGATLVTVAADTAVLSDGVREHLSAVRSLGGSSVG